MKKIYNISILWGTDGFGKWLAAYLLQHFWEYISLTLTGNKREKGESVSKELWIRFLQDNIQAVQAAHIVIYAVPISVTQKIIEETLKYIPAWAIVADVTSIKKFPSAAMSERDDLIVIPTHPMFGPYIASIAGQVIVLTPCERVKYTEEYVFFKHFLESQKAKVIEESPEYHDKMMAVVQGLTHLNMFVVGETMKRLGFRISDSLNFVSPIYKLMISSVGRYVGQNPQLYADIQMYNDEVLEVHEKFLDTAKNFHQSVQDKNSEKFCRDITEARAFLWEDTCREWQEYTDKIIYLLGRQIEKLKSSLWNTICIKNIYSWEEKTGELLDFSGKEIFLDDKKSYILDQWEVL